MNALDNILWNALAGPQAKFAAGTAHARRYASGFSPIVAFADAAHPDWQALVPFCEPGEHFYCADWSGAVPPGWHLEAESTMYRMVWDAPVLEEAANDGAVRLGPEHADAALALAQMTRPGPFGPRTIELGEYWGCFQDGELVAMAGERMHAPGLREISGVCTHPASRGQGHARRLMEKLIARQLRRGELPFLHVMRDNPSAHELYLRMGFRDWREGAVRVIARVA